MKKILTLIALIAILALSGSAQSIFKPVPKNLFKKDGLSLEKDIKPSMWLPRISVGVMATQWNIVDDKIEQQSFNKTGVGLSYAHFIEIDGLPYNNVSINGFIFFATDGTAKPAIAVTASVLRYLQFGLDYDFGIKKPGLLTGISYTF